MCVSVLDLCNCTTGGTTHELQEIVSYLISQKQKEKASNVKCNEQSFSTLDSACTYSKKLFMLFKGPILSG